LTTVIALFHEPDAFTTYWDSLWLTVKSRYQGWCSTCWAQSRYSTTVHSTFLSKSRTQMILGLGTDIVEIDRIRSMIDRHGDSFLRRCFTDPEIAYAAKHRDAAVRFAGRWAAKEAVVKVLGTGFVKGITFHDIEVLPMDSGQPRIALSGGAGDLATKLGMSSVLITISHAKLYATATAVGITAAS
jgi:holo-[acyl-carrier protein] synthase